MSQYDGAVKIKFTADQSEFEDAVKDTDEKLKDTGDTAGETSEKFGELDVAAIAVAASVVKLGKDLLDTASAAVQASSDFEAAFAKTQTIMDANAMAAEDMRQGILTLSDESAMAAGNVSEAVYQAISGSVDTAQAVGFVDKANKLAVAGFTELESATDILTTTLNAYQLSEEKVAGISNVLIQTQNLGKTSVNELSASMGRAIATGSAYGINLQNIATTYVELTRSGIATAEATTYQASMFNELGDAGSKVGTILQEQTGKSFGQLMAEGQSLGDVLGILSQSVNGSAEAMMGLWSSQEAGKAANAIMVQGLEDFNNIVGQMNSEMDGATGTTEKAYATMTDTAEFIDKKFKNSIENLKIAFGDQLSPAVSEAKELLTGLIDGVTDIIRNDPAILGVIVGAAAGFGVLTISLVAYSIKAKIATSETLKMTAAMATNPILLAVSAVAALTGGIIAMALSANDGTQSISSMTEASRNLSDTVSNAEAAYNETAEQIDGTAAVAQQYVSRLKELESQQSMTEAEQQEYAMTVEKLKVLIPDLNAELDEQTGLLLGGADAIQSQIDNWHELAIAKAIQTKYADEIQAEAEAEVELAENEKKRSQLLAQQSLLEEQISQKTAEKIRLYERSATLLSEIDTAQNSGNNSHYYNFSSAEAQLAQYGEEATQLSSDISFLSGELENLPAEIADVDKAIDKNKAAIEENKGAVDAAAEAYQNWSDSQTGAIDTADAASDAWTEAADALKLAYDEAYNSALQSIDGQIKLFNDMGDTVTTISNITQESAQNATSGFISSLDSQIAYLDTYATNMQIAAERGINQGLLQQLSDGSAESAEILANLVNATDEQIAEMNQKWDKVSDGKENFASSMAEYTGVVEDEKTKMVDLAAQAGKDMSEAITQELLNGFDDYKLAWSQYQNIRSSTLRKTAPVRASAYASGTSYAAPGVALVGEEGPELIYLRGGERILTAEETRAAYQDIQPKASSYMAPDGMSQVGSGKRNARMTATIVVPVNVDGRQIAKATAEYVGEEMDFGVI